MGSGRARGFRAAAVACAVGLSAGAAAGGCAAGGEQQGSAGGQVQSSFERPSHGDLASLTAASSTVVLGTVGGFLGTEEDSTGEDIPEELSGPTMAFHDFAVGEVLAGEAPAELVLGVTAGDIVSEDLIELSEGADMLLFLEFVPDEESPGTTSVGDAYVVTAMANGAFDVDGQKAVPRSPYDFVAPEDPEDPADPDGFAAARRAASFDLDELRAEVARAASS